MKLVLELSGREGQAADQWSLEGHGMSIGRGDDNDWVLPDPNRHLSKQHCKIDYRDGQYLLTDTSTNGIFVNHSSERLPRGASVRINDGDIIQLGSYQIVAGLVESGGLSGSPQDPFGDLPEPYEEAPIIAPRNQAPANQSFESPDAFVPNLGRHDAGLVDDPDPFLDRSDPMSGGPGATGDALDPFGGGHPGQDDDLFSGPPSRGARPLIPEDSDLIGPDLDSGPLEDDLLGDNSQEQWQGPAASNHHSAANEYFRPPEVASHSLPEDNSVIPDDFDEEFGGAPSPAPALQPAIPAPAGPGIQPAAQPDPFAAPAPIAPAPIAPAPIAPAPIAPAPIAPAPVAPAPVAPTPVAPQPVAPPVPQAVPMGPAADASVGRAFLAAAGLKDLQVSDAEMAALMVTVGATYRAMVEGMRELLLTRSSLKNEFRIDQTMIGPRENNPLKFSASTEEALLALLKPPVAGYMTPEKAVQEGLKDVASHQMAVMAGMQEAIASLLKRFDPETLAKRMDKHASLRDMVPGGKKARYWEVFVELYGEIVAEAEDDFQSLFGKEFSKAYKEQSRKI